MRSKLIAPPKTMEPQGIGAGWCEEGDGDEVELKICGLIESLGNRHFHSYPVQINDYLLFLSIEEWRYILEKVN